MKQTILVTGPVKTRSGYGNHARDICRALIELDKMYKIATNLFDKLPADKKDKKYRKKLKDLLS